MKVGLSSYSMVSKLQSGEMTILDVIQWTADHGGEHVEIVPIGFELDEHLIEEIPRKAAEAGVAISNYAVGADFINRDFHQEIAEIKKQVDIAARLGVKRMRHDVAWRSPAESTVQQFEKDLPDMVKACQEIASHAEQYGITTSIENHGVFVQAADRVQRLVELVDRENFKTTLDIGNFMCVDEDSVVAVRKNMPYASMVHVKDFYLRPFDKNPGEGWFQTASGNYLRGAIFGQGDIDVRNVLKVIQEAGYDSYISLEFEGMEDCEKGSKIGMNNLRRLWNEMEESQHA